MKKTLRKIIPAIAMLLISATLVGTSTFAWFSMNNTVTVTGMSVTTKVGSNLLIKEDTLASTTRITDSNFTTAVNNSMPAQLEPVSTTTAKNFFYTTNALATGVLVPVDGADNDCVVYNAAEVPTSGAGSELEAFNTAYGTTGAVGYVDYVFQLKAVNAQDAAKDIKITKLNLIYGDAQDTGKAFRAAVLVEDITTANSGNPVGGSGTLKGIYAPSGAANHEGKAVSGVETLTAITYNSVSNIASVPANETGYYKVVVRLYLEGQDTTCKNDTYARLTEDWALDLELKLDDATTNTAVSSIAQYTSANVNATTYYYDGTSVWTDRTKIGTDSADKVAIASADSDVQDAFGYVAP